MSQKTVLFDVIQQKMQRVCLQLNGSNLSSKPSFNDVLYDEHGTDFGNLLLCEITGWNPVEWPYIINSMKTIQESTKWFFEPCFICSMSRRIRNFIPRSEIILANKQESKLMQMLKSIKLDNVNKYEICDDMESCIRTITNIFFCITFTSKPFQFVNTYHL